MMETTDLQVGPPSIHNLKPRVLVIGVGGAGGNAINNMRSRAIPGVEYLYTNTDAQALESSEIPSKLQLGESVTKGLGAGADPEIGAEAARESINDLRSHIEDVNMVFIAAGMGGGTGTGAAPVIAQLCREMNILTVGVVSRPFSYEGAVRRKVADEGIAKMREHVDTLVVIPNQNLFRVISQETTFIEAFRIVDDILCEAVRGVTDLMMVHGLINLDFNDVCTILQGKGDAMMGVGESEGEGRGKAAAEKAITNPLLENGISLKTSAAMLVNITGGEDLTLYDVDEALQRITSETGEETNVIHGATIDSSINGRIRVSIIATGVKFVNADVSSPGGSSGHGSGSGSGNSGGNTGGSRGSDSSRYLGSPNSGVQGSNQGSSGHGGALRGVASSGEKRSWRQSLSNSTLASDQSELARPLDANASVSDDLVSSRGGAPSLAISGADSSQSTADGAASTSRDNKDRPASFGTTTHSGSAHSWRNKGDVHLSQKYRPEPVVDRDPFIPEPTTLVNVHLASSKISGNDVTTDSGHKSAPHIGAHHPLGGNDVKQSMASQEESPSSGDYRKEWKQSSRSLSSIGTARHSSSDYGALDLEGSSKPVPTSTSTSTSTAATVQSTMPRTVSKGLWRFDHEGEYAREIDGSVERGTPQSSDHLLRDESSRKSLSDKPQRRSFWDRLVGRGDGEDTLSNSATPSTTPSRGKSFAGPYQPRITSEEAIVRKRDSTDGGAVDHGSTPMGLGRGYQDGMADSHSAAQSQGSPMHDHQEQPRASLSNTPSTTTRVVGNSGSALLQEMPHERGVSRSSVADDSVAPSMKKISGDGGPDPDDPLRDETDQDSPQNLKIPAFLRRQAN